ncbi:hypothetical protein [Streptosporangium sp. H16]
MSVALFRFRAGARAGTTTSIPGTGGIPVSTTTPIPGTEASL